MSNVSANTLAPPLSGKEASHNGPLHCYDAGIFRLRRANSARFPAELGRIHGFRAGS